ncbi:AraC family transcriptional regulator [Brevibacillus laterosporus]|uniref:ABC transporter substrate-binding protein n=1 Tax=Brevibacillus laterosporus TaxID=1465 RepID=UPI000C755D6D|nr:AraC family transcriptional regulator [Brevibacillus laterosporus]AUM63339.1 AraC family transcriptional regulator [Brevibacillus laterosporus]
MSDQQQQHSFSAESTVEIDQYQFKLKEIELLKGSQYKPVPLIHQMTSSYVLLIALQGQGHVLIDEQAHPLQKDGVYVCAPGQTLGLELTPEVETYCYVIYFHVYQESGKRRGQLKPVRDKGPFEKGGQVSHTISQPTMLCQTIEKQWKSKKPMDRFLGQITFLQFIHTLMNNKDIRFEDSKTAIAKAKTYIDTHFNKNLCVEDLAKIAGVSSKYFGELFKKTYGIGAIEYVTKVRMNQAKQFMSRPQVRLKDVAHQIGYNDEFYFSRKFKQEVGVSPTTYMKQRQKKVAIYSHRLLGYVLALQVIPYAAPLHPKWSSIYYEKYRTEIPIHLSAYRVDYRWESNIEVLEQIHPDLIISIDQLEGKEKAKLEQAGSVSYVSWSDTDWRAQFLQTAELLQVPQDADKWLTSYDHKVKMIREEISGVVKNDTFLIVRLLKQNIYVYSNPSMTQVFYGDLQMIPAHPLHDVGIDEKITIQKLAEYDPDHILVLACPESETLHYWKQLQMRPEWQQIRAVRLNNVHEIFSNPWRDYSPLAHERLIEDVYRLFSGNRPY